MTKRRKPCNSVFNSVLLNGLYLKVALTGFTFLILLTVHAGIQQHNDGLVSFSVKKYPFIHSDRNEIINAKALDSFFHELFLLKTEKQTRLSILQIGDSHIQADFLSAEVRTDFQKDFGNAGRGLVVPLRVAHSNEPFNYRITSNVVCDAKRCVFVNEPLPIGLGGVTIKTTSDSVAFRVTTFNYPPINYAFNKLSLYYLKNDTSYDFDVTDTLGNKLASINSSLESANANMSSVQLPGYTNDVIIQAKRTNPQQTNATIFGLNLENDSSGILYHSVGVNGAEAYEYVHAQYFAEETPLLHPSLIIISLGTNEAQHRPLDRELTAMRLDSMIKQVQLYNPDIPIILTTPPDSYYKRRYYNINVNTVHAIEVEYAKKHNLAIWDLYSIAGGYKSCYQWKKYGLMQYDGMHFIRKGYEFQGDLFYEAIIKAYNKYVTTRPQ